jgi:hypothetical protein
MIADHSGDWNNVTSDLREQKLTQRSSEAESSSIATISAGSFAPFSRKPSDAEKAKRGGEVEIA